MNFISIFKRVCSDQGVKASIDEERAGKDYLYTCQRGCVRFEFFVETKGDTPAAIQYGLLNSDNELDDANVYDHDDGSMLTENDMEECIIWMLEDANERYENETKFRKLLNKVFAQVDNHTELQILFDVFTDLYKNH